MATILHVDLDAFFASVEQRDDPSLRGRPLIVAGHSRRGVVLAASYEVRPFGVRSAMPLAEALRLAPQATVVPPRRERYEEASAETFAIFRRFTPLVEPLSLDEAFLDVTASRSLFGSGDVMARAIKEAVRREVGLTASAGVAPSKFVAKIASDLSKPDGLLLVPEDGVVAFLAPLPIERMWGVGPKTAPKMRAAGFHTLGDLASASPRVLEGALGAWAAVARRLARGDDPRSVEPDGAARSIGAEQTYENDLVDRDAVGRSLLEHASRVARRMVRSNLSAVTVTLKIKYADFAIRTRRVTLPEPVRDTDALHETALQLLGRVPLEGRRVRLTGLSVSGFVRGPPPPSLLPNVKLDKRTRVEELAAQIGERFQNEAALTRASLIERPHASGEALPHSVSPRGGERQRVSPTESERRKAPSLVKPEKARVP